MVSPLAFGLPCLLALWLWYRVDQLEKQTEFLNDQVSYLNGEVSSVQAQVNYVIPLAENANNNAHSHYDTWSDERFKTNVQALNSSLDKVLSLRGVEYNWTEEAQAELGLGEGTEIGLVAQDVEKVFHELVSIDSAGYKRIDYARLAAVLFEAIREQQAMIDDLEVRLSAFERK